MNISQTILTINYSEFVEYCLYTLKNNVNYSQVILRNDCQLICILAAWYFMNSSEWNNAMTLSQMNYVNIEREQTLMYLFKWPLA